MTTRKTNWTRRRFLRNSALGAGAVSILPILGTRSARAVQGIRGRFMVVVNMLGGNDGLNMVVPTHLTPYVERRPAINLVENLPANKSLHDLSGGFKLHYNLPTVKSIWDDNDLHVVQKVSYPNPNQSHFTSQDIFSFGVRDSGNGDGRGWLGRFADEYASNPSEPLGVVSVGLGRRRDFEANETDPAILNTVESFVIDADDNYRTDHVLRERVAREILAGEPSPGAEPALSIFQANGLAYSLIEQVQAETADYEDPNPGYPTTGLGRNLRTIAKMLAGQDVFNTKVFYTGLGGFDTHANQHLSGGNNEGRHASLMKQLDDALAIFRADLKARRLWNSCTIVVISEFGRRVFENGSFGTDHGHGNAFLVMGGRVKGQLNAGGMTGELLESHIDTESTVPFGIDFRDLYGNVIQNHLGVAPAPIFPDIDYTPAHGDIDLV